MLVLLVTKYSNFDLYNTKINILAKQVELFAHEQKRLKQEHFEHQQTFNRLIDLLSENNIKYDVIQRNCEEFIIQKNYDYIITIGGDGTICYTAQKFDYPVNIVGVRSTSYSIGYLCAYDLYSLNDLVHDINNKHIRCFKVYRIKAKINHILNKTIEITTPALNEILFSAINPGHTTRYYIEYNGVCEFHKSSGIYVATGVGSTASVASAGGRQMPIDSNEFQFVIREPYYLEKQKFNIISSIFNPEEQGLKIYNMCEKAILCLDGAHSSYNIDYGDIVEFIRAEPIYLAIRKEKYSNIDIIK